MHFSGVDSCSHSILSVLQGICITPLVWIVLTIPIDYNNWYFSMSFSLNYKIRQ